MISKGTDQFELRLGKLGLAIFIIGISCLMFTAFQFGIMVGKDMDAYPEKAVEGLPAYIKQKIIKNPETVTAVQKEAKTGTPQNEKAEMDLTFYDTLAGKKPKIGLTPQKALEEKVATQEEPAKEKQPVQKAPEEKVVVQQKEQVKEKQPVNGKIFVQVVSLKDQKKAEDIRKSLTDMGYRSELDITEVNGGKFYRVKLIGFEDREGAVKAATAVEKRYQFKCIVKNKE